MSQWSEKSNAEQEKLLRQVANNVLEAKDWKEFADFMDTSNGRVLMFLEATVVAKLREGRITRTTARKSYLKLGLKIPNEMQEEIPF